MLASCAIYCDLLLVKSEHVVSAPDINEFIQKDILVFIRITLHIHSFGSGISNEGVDFANCKLDIIQV